DLNEGIDFAVYLGLYQNIPRRIFENCIPPRPLVLDIGAVRAPTRSASRAVWARGGDRTDGLRVFQALRQRCARPRTRRALGGNNLKGRPASDVCDRRAHGLVPKHLDLRRLPWRLGARIGSSMAMANRGGF